jgi:hypothetical protein
MSRGLSASPTLPVARCRQIVATQEIGALATVPSEFRLRHARIASMIFRS